MPIPEPWVAAIRRWAATEPRIETIHLFGSRAKGTDRATSDLDLAVTITDEPEDNALGFWIFEGARLKARLAPMLPVCLDLQCRLPDDTVVGPAVAEHGVELYRR